jgi:D-threo-aldose 1-dehydrogenase
MTRTITIPGTGLVTSALGFGCADLYRQPSAVQRRRLLDSAHAAGIRHFDVAPMYGLGLAERELGRFARERREHVVIATKFGIEPTLAAAMLARLQGPVRRLFAAIPSLRRRARAGAAGPGGAGALLYRATGFDGGAARASLERSLRRLGTDRVDLLLLHDPQPGDMRSDDVCDVLEAARSAGDIREWGVAGEPGPASAVAAALPVDVPILQVRDDVLAHTPPSGRSGRLPGRISFGVLGGALALVVAHVAADERRRRRWREAIGSDCAVPEVAAALMLRLAARHNPDGVILFSTIRSDHLLAAVAALSAPAGAEAVADDLDAFERLLATEPPAVAGADR